MFVPDPCTLKAGVIPLAACQPVPALNEYPAVLDACQRESRPACAAVVVAAIQNFSPWLSEGAPVSLATVNPQVAGATVAIVEASNVPGPFPHMSV